MNTVNPPHVTLDPGAVCPGHNSPSSREVGDPNARLTRSTTNSPDISPACPATCNAPNVPSVTISPVPVVEADTELSSGMTGNSGLAGAGASRDDDAPPVGGITLQPAATSANTTPLDRTTRIVARRRARHASDAAAWLSRIT